MAAGARLFFADSERNADLYYLTGFLAGDPFLFLEAAGRRTLFLSDLEVDRGRAQATVDEVVRLQEIVQAIEEEGELPTAPWDRMARIVERIANERTIGAFEVSGDFPLALADALRDLGLGVRAGPTPFVPARACKTPAEVEKIRGAVRHTEAALRAAIDRLRAAEIRDGMLFEDGRSLTSEMVRLGIDLMLRERQCYAYEAIVAGGEHAVDPHERGHGPLPAHRPIILDVFPRDLKTRYHGDMTRTVVRGEASDEARRMFDAVRAAKASAEAVLKEGCDGRDVHKACEDTFLEAGFETGVRDGRMVGFFHGTGHGLGLDVHEYPRVSKVPDTLRAGHVVTIEPGLYYPGVGGVRLEDDVLVTKDGHENLCTLEAEFEL